MIKKMISAMEEKQNTKQTNCILHFYASHLVFFIWAAINEIGKMPKLY